MFILEVEKLKRIKGKMIDKLVRIKGKSKLPKLWYDIPKSTKKLDKVSCRCDISIDEYMAVQTWQTRSDQNFLIEVKTKTNNNEIIKENVYN